MNLLVSARAVERSFALIASLLLMIVNDTPAVAQQQLRAGDSYAITLTRDSVERSSDGTSEGSSHDKDTIVERVIAVRPDGLELEYELPDSATPEERAADWHFPARVFRLPDGSLQLLNRAELEARIDPWLKAANWTRSVCGHWIFTWNAFHIDCDPQSVIGTIQAFNLRAADLADGAPFREDDALGPGIVKKSVAADGAIFSVEMTLDPEKVRRARADSDVVLGDMVNKPITLDMALRERSKEAISGTIFIKFEIDEAGSIFRRTKITKVETKKLGGPTETQTITETLERRRIQKR